PTLARNPLFRNLQKRMRQIEHVDFAEAGQAIGAGVTALCGAVRLRREIFQIRSRPAPHINPRSALRRLDEIPQLLPPLQEPLAEIVVRPRLARIKTLHPRSMIFATHRLQGEVVENLEVRSEAHLENQRTEEPKNPKPAHPSVLWFFGSWSFSSRQVCDIEAPIRMHPI